MEISKFFILDNTSEVKHLKRLHHHESVCNTNHGVATKELFEVTCPSCLGIVISRRVQEITYIQKAIEANKSVRAVVKPEFKKIMIRY